MKPFLKIIFTLALVFASTFILVRLTGIFSLEDIENWLQQAKTLHPVYVAIIIIALLAVDIFLAIPTLSLCILAGYFLGPFWGGTTATIGMALAGLLGYALSAKYGESILKLIISQEQKRSEAKETFKKYGLPVILLSRSSPIFPEVCACMAGMTQMRFYKFLTAWLINTVPYAYLASYSGSISSLSNPKPAIYTAIAMYATLWLSWLLFKTFKNKTKLI